MYYRRVNTPHNYFSFNEPSLLCELQGKSEFPENILEDQPFPEFINLKKRESQSFRIIENKKQIFCETAFNFEKR